MTVNDLRLDFFPDDFEVAGECFFTAIAHGINAGPDGHTTDAVALRERLAEFMATDDGGWRVVHIMQTVADPLLINHDYLGALRRRDTYVDHPEIQAMADMLLREIVIIRDVDGRVTTIRPTRYAYREGTGYYPAGQTPTQGPPLYVYQQDVRQHFIGLYHHNRPDLDPVTRVPSPSNPLRKPDKFRIERVSRVSFFFFLFFWSLDFSL